ncbi:hypothetical protein ACFWU5_09340 [Nocardia sp. NPDC058640]|uniref:hypothetical protein n=1 Tax=Nocardia sp. NPDC058640 TaxID=3346571 RepID=UPI0036621796
MSSTPIQPRPLTDLESAVVTKMLSGGGTGADEFRAQIPYSQVVSTWGIGSPSVDLVVQQGAARAVDSADGIFANGAVTDERPRTLPEPDLIEVGDQPSNSTIGGQADGKE